MTKGNGAPDYGKRFDIGDIVIIEINRVDSTLKFYVNGQS